ncbi:MAG: tetratricopeptide repeat protein, partial [Roseiarcus sp.]
MTGRLLFAHALLWRSDGWYRRTWYVAPQLAAVVAAGWLLTSGGPGPVDRPPDVAENWGVPLPQRELSSAADALRDRARTDPREFESLKRQAELGDQFMQFAMGTLYDSTLNLTKVVAPDMNEALKYYRAAAEQGHPYAAFNYANTLVLGRGVPRDVTAALPFLVKAANANLPPAAKLLGILYRDGNGVPPDKMASLKWFRQAADKGDLYSAAEIGAAYWDGAPAYPKDQAEAVQWFLKAAIDPKIVNPAINLGVDLGIAYRDGTGVQQDRAQSLKWFRIAAEKGNTYAAAEIGAAYWDGASPYPKDPAAAVQWFLKAAADPAEVYAARNLGVAYRDGTGVQQDKATSLRWFRQAAFKGDAFSATEIGAAYWDGAPAYPKDP